MGTKRINLYPKQSRKIDPPHPQIHAAHLQQKLKKSVQQMLQIPGMYKDHMSQHISLQNNTCISNKLLIELPHVAWRWLPVEPPISLASFNLGSLVVESESVNQPTCAKGLYSIFHLQRVSGRIGRLCSALMSTNPRLQIHSRTGNSPWGYFCSHS